MNKRRSGKNKYNKRTRRRSQGVWLFPGLVAAGILVAGIGIGVTAHGKKAEKAISGTMAGTEPDAKTVESTAPDNMLPQPEIRVGQVDLTGLTKEATKEKLNQEFDWKLTITDGQETVSVENLIRPQLEEIELQIERDGMKQSHQYELDYNRMEDKLISTAQELAGRWNKNPVNSQLESFDKETKAFSYTKEENGKLLNQDELVQKLMETIRQGDYQAEVKADFTAAEPVRTQAMAKEKYQVIGTFQTKTTENKNRNENIRLAVEAIDGMVLKPGEEFSFNQSTGNRTTDKGYRPAGAYKNGKLIEEPGGGVCQVSTTLYNAIIKSGYETTERNFHSFAPSYIEKGQDAMVSFDGYAGPDLRFVNTQNTTIAIRASFQNQELKISVVGLLLLEDGETVSLKSEKVQDIEPQPPVYEENPELLYGQEKVIEQAQPGSVWKTYRVVTKGGKEVDRQLLHTSTYKAKTAVIQRNTKAFPQEEPIADPGQESPNDAQGQHLPSGPAFDTENQPQQVSQVTADPLQEQSLIQPKPEELEIPKP